VLAELVQVAERETGLEPNVDFALTALAAAYRLPEDAALILFAAGRTAGWLAHAIEQAMTGQLIRPRGRYTAMSLES
jgi:citrate synthase